jgi:hypothetical protein
MKFSIAAAAIAAVAATGAQAATIVDASARTSVVDLTNAANKNLSNNGAYASGSGANAVAYLFNEGSNVAGNNATTQALGIAGQTVQTFLLHYDRQNGSGFLGGLATGSVAGSFGFSLAANEVLLGFAGFSSTLLGAPGEAQALRDTDFRSDVIYPNTTFTTFLFRGTEGSFLGDSLSLSDPTPANGPATIGVNYRLSSTGSSLDEIRFFIGTTSAVPEPATWAMMIGGIGMVGGAMRRRRGARTGAAFA